jgi:acyl carrier protein
MDQNGTPVANDSIEERIHRLVLEYAQRVPAHHALDPRLSLRGDLEIESLSLVSVAIRLGEEFGVDLTESGIDLGRLETVGDLVAMGHELARTRPAGTGL